MKKNLFILATAAFALASCSNEEVVELNNGNAIDFRVAMSRGAETTTDNIGQFYVTAIDNGANYFTGVIFKKDGTTFTSTEKYRWPGKDELNFYAYSYFTGYKDADAKILNDLDLTKLGKVTINKDEKTISGFSPATDVADQIDFVTATAKGSVDDETTGVSLTFQHNLIQTEVYAKTSNGTYTFEVKGVKFANIKSKGTFDFAPAEGKNSWTLDNDMTDYAVLFDVNDVKTLGATPVGIDSLGKVGHPMLLPQSLTPWDRTSLNLADPNKGAYLAVYIKITTNNDDHMQVYPKSGDYGWALMPLSTNWIAGHRYVYTLDFSNGAGYDEEGNPILGGPITFTETVKGWDNGTTGDVNFTTPVE